MVVVFMPVFSYVCIFCEIDNIKDKNVHKFAVKGDFF